MGTVTKSDNNFFSDSEQIIASFTFSSSYPTGGEAITASDLGAVTGSIKHLSANSAGGYVFEWDQANGKLLAYQAPHGHGAAIPLPQVPNTTDLSAVTARIIAYVSAN